MSQSARSSSTVRPSVHPPLQIYIKIYIKPAEHQSRLLKCVRVLIINDEYISFWCSRQSLLPSNVPFYTFYTYIRVYIIQPHVIRLASRHNLCSYVLTRICLKIYIDLYTHASYIVKRILSGNWLCCRNAAIIKTRFTLLKRWLVSLNEIFDLMKWYAAEWIAIQRAKRNARAHLGTPQHMCVCAWVCCVCESHLMATDCILDASISVESIQMNRRAIRKTKLR